MPLFLHHSHCMVQIAYYNNRSTQLLFIFYFCVFRIFNYSRNEWIFYSLCRNGSYTMLENTSAPSIFLGRIDNRRKSIAKHKICIRIFCHNNWNMQMCLIYSILWYPIWIWIKFTQNNEESDQTFRFPLHRAAIDKHSQLENAKIESSSKKWIDNWYIVM